MKKNIIIRVNLLLGTMIGALLGLNSCEQQNVVLVKYGAPDVDTTVRLMYGVPAPQPLDDTQTTK